MGLRIHFQRTGGFAGPATARSYTVDADDLPTAEAAELRDLLQGIDVASPAAQTSGRAGPAQPDEFRYRLVIDHGDRSQTIEASDTAMPAGLRPLVKWLTRRASASPKGKG
jgi:hypothetical protein